MPAIASVRMKQPHVEQVHRKLLGALGAFIAIQVIAKEKGLAEIVSQCEQGRYEIESATQWMPPKQPKLPL